MRYIANYDLSGFWKLVARGASVETARTELIHMGRISMRDAISRHGESVATQVRDELRLTLILGPGGRKTLRSPEVEAVYATLLSTLDFSKEFPTPTECEPALIQANNRLDALTAELTRLANLPSREGFQGFVEVRQKATSAEEARLDLVNTGYHPAIVEFVCNHIATQIRGLDNCYNHD